MAGLAFLIIIVFIILYSISGYLVSHHTIKKHWTSYRCNPLIMPFAGSFGKDPQETLSHCTQMTQNRLAPFKIQPLNYHISTIHDTLDSHITSMQKTRGFMSSFRGGALGSVHDIFGSFTLALAETKVLLARLRDMLGKSGAAILTLLRWMEAGVTTVGSAADGDSLVTKIMNYESAGI